MENINYVSIPEMTREEKIEMFRKLTKRELIEMLMENQRMVQSLVVNLNPLMPIPEIPSWSPTIWHGINHPTTGEPIGSTYTDG